MVVTMGHGYLIKYLGCFAGVQSNSIMYHPLASCDLHPSIDTPTTSEGYTEQFSVSSQLICNSQYEVMIV